MEALFKCDLHIVSRGRLKLRELILCTQKMLILLIVTSHVYTFIIDSTVSLYPRGRAYVHFILETKPVANQREPYAWIGNVVYNCHVFVLI